MMLMLYLCYYRVARESWPHSRSPERARMFPHHRHSPQRQLCSSTGVEGLQRFFVSKQLYLIKSPLFYFLTFKLKVELPWGDILQGLSFTLNQAANQHVHLTAFWKLKHLICLAWTRTPGWGCESCLTLRKNARGFPNVKLFLYKL